LVDGDAVVVTPGGAQATIVALNKKTGAVIWKSAVPGGDAAGYASAIMVQAPGRKQYVQFLSKGLVGVDAKTGQFLWRYAEVAKGPAQMWTPNARGESVYAAANGVGGGLVRLKADGTAEQVYFERGLPNGVGGAVLIGDYLYGSQAEQKLVAVEFATGKVKWQAESIGWSSAYRIKGRFTPPAQPQHKKVGPFPEGAFSHPVIANGRLYIHDVGTLWVYDIKG
jgi:outer membrane protein assembly factor BamB